MRPSNITRLLTKWLPKLHSVWLHGKPGIGKTDVVEQACEMAGMHLWRHPPAICVAEIDIAGLPNIKDGRMTRAMPDFWPTAEDQAKIGKKLAVFLDELPQGTFQTQAAYMQAIWSRRIGQFEMAKDICFIAAGNRPEDKAGANKVLTPLGNRFRHIDFDVDVDDWLDWARAAGIDQSVRGFVAWKRSEALDNFDPKWNERAWASPRSWAMLSSCIPDTDEDLLHEAATGVVGPVAAEWMGYREVVNDLPSLDVIYKKPDTTAVPASKPAVLVALAIALAEDARNRPDLAPLAIYAQRMPPEMSALCLHETTSCIAYCPKCKGPNGGVKKLINPSGRDWMAQHKDVLQGRSKPERSTDKTPCRCK